MSQEMDAGEKKAGRRWSLRSANGITLLCLIVIALGALAAILAHLHHRATPLERYKRDLGSPKRYVRSVAAHRLGRMGPDAAEAVPLLIELLTDRKHIFWDMEPDNYRLTREVNKYIGDRPEDPVEFAGMIIHSSPSDQARRALVRIGEASVPHLIESFRKSRFPEFRVTVAEILLELKAPAAVPVLTETILASDDPFFSHSLFLVLYRFGPASLRAQVRIWKEKPGYTETWPEVDSEAWWSTPARECLSEAPKDPDPDVRAYARMTFRKFPPGEGETRPLK